MLDLWKAKRGPQRQLSLGEVLTLNIMRFYFHIFDLKAFVRIAGNAYKACFPRLPNYENFLKAANRSFPFTVLLLHYFLMLNRQMSRERIFFFDSTALSVCSKWNIPAHRLTKGYASREKTSKGCFTAKSRRLLGRRHDWKGAGKLPSFLTTFQA